MLGGVRPMGPPLDPTAQEARRWAEEELARSIYQQGPTLLERILRWLLERWEELVSLQGAGAVLLPVVVLVLVAAVVTVAMVLGGPLRRRRVRQRDASSALVLDDDERSAERLRAAADAAAGAGDYATAVLERFRAIVRGLDERGILTDHRGRTAREAAGRAGAAFAQQARELRSAADLFDGVCYGSTVPGPQQDTWLHDLDRAICSTRPTAAPAPSSGDGWSVVR